MNTMFAPMNRAEWRHWLHKHHRSTKEIWLVYYKKQTRRPCISYETSVEEALCFGWIDSLIKRIDDERYARKFTPRANVKRWSASNIRRVKKLVQERRMTAAGLAAVKAAGSNFKPEKPPEILMPKELRAALQKNAIAKKKFSSLAPSYQRPYMAWIAMAKTVVTRQKRLTEALTLLEQNKKLGLK